MRRMIRLLPLILGIVAPGLCGCVAHTYSSLTVEPLSEVAQERQRARRVCRPVHRTSSDQIMTSTV